MQSITPHSPFMMVDASLSPTVELPLTPRSPPLDLPTTNDTVDKEIERQFITMLQDLLGAMAVRQVVAAIQDKDREVDERLRRVEEGRVKKRAQFRRIFSTTPSSSPGSYSPLSQDYRSMSDSELPRPYGLLR